MTRHAIQRGLGIPLVLFGLLSGCDNAPSGAGDASGNERVAGDSKGSKGPVLRFVTNTYSDFWAAAEKGMKDGAAEFGARVEMRKNLKGETQRQIEFLEEALNQRDVQGVAVSVVDSKAVGVADVLKRLNDAGKIVITIDSDIAQDSANLRRAYIGTQNHEAGMAAGRAAAAIRPNGGEVAVFVGIPSAANAIERRDGFFEGAGAAFKQQEVFGDKTEKKIALDNVQIAVSKYPDLGLLLGLWSYNAPAIGDFVASAPDLKKRLNVVTFDLDANAIPHVEKGLIDATICQNPYMMGYQGVKLLKALVEKDQATIDQILPNGATMHDTGLRIVVPNADSPVKGDNVMTIEEMKSWLASKGLSST